LLIEQGSEFGPGLPFA